MSRKALLLVWLLPGSWALAQVPISPVPDDPSDADLGEVEEVVPDSEFLPSEGRQVPLPDKKATGKIEKDHERELELTQAELRQGFAYYGTLALGMVVPWQTYGIAFGTALSDVTSIGFAAGGGSFDERGIVDETAVEKDFTARSFSLSGRYSFRSLEPLAVEGFLGYASWEGKVKPEGADEAEPDDSGRITTAFRAHGSFVGLSAVLTALWKNGFFVEWTPLGLWRGKVYDTELTRETRLAQDAVDARFETFGIFGLTNIRIGYWF